MQLSRQNSCNAIASMLHRTNNFVVNEIKSHQSHVWKREVEEKKKKVNNKTRINKLLFQQELQYEDSDIPPKLNYTSTNNQNLNSSLSQRDVLKRKILPNLSNRPRSASQFVRKVCHSNFHFMDELGSIHTGILEEYEQHVMEDAKVKYDLLEEDYYMHNISLQARQTRPHGSSHTNLFQSSLAWEDILPGEEHREKEKGEEGNGIIAEKEVLNVSIPMSSSKKIHYSHRHDSDSDNGSDSNSDSDIFKEERERVEMSPEPGQHRYSPGLSPYEGSSVLDLKSFDSPHWLITSHSPLSLPRPSPKHLYQQHPQLHQLHYLPKQCLDKNNHSKTKNKNKNKHTG